MEFTLKVTISEPVPPRVTAEWVREWFEDELDNTVGCNLRRDEEMPSVRVTLAK